MKWALLLLLFGGFVGAIYWKQSRRARGGALAFETVVVGALGGESDIRKVPGRDDQLLDRADVWRIDLRAGETVTINACASTTGGSTVTPHFVVQGVGANDPITRTADLPYHPNQSVLVYTPTASGQHAIWLYKHRNTRSFGYRLQVTRGARSDPGVDLCLGPYY